MAMLAEKRTKKPKYNLIRAKTNANWAQETNSWGLKMLQKMGWSEGKGLGVDESGTAEPLHITYKNDNRGLGCLNLEGDMAVSQQKDFDALLANLAQENGNSEEAPKHTEERTPKSLELMSQKSRARVHYHKFTRGKDLSRASKKDLASILGIADTISVQEKLDEVVPAVGPRLEDKLLKSCGSSVDYFKKLKKSKKEKVQLENAVNTNSEEEKSSEDVASNREENSPSNTPTLNSTQDSSFSNGRRKSVTWGDVEVSFVSKYIKEMVDTSTESVDEASANELESTEAAEEHVENGPKKKKMKKSKKRHGEIHLHVDGASEDTVVSPTEAGHKKKKKRNKEEVEEIEKIDDNSLDCSSSIEHSVVDNTSLKKLKKKSKDKGKELDESFTASSENSNNVSIKSKKKKQKHTNLNDNTNEEGENVVSLEDEFEEKKGSKKRKGSEADDLDETESRKGKFKKEVIEVKILDKFENKKGKNKRKLCEVEDGQETQVPHESPEVTSSKKKTKQKHKNAPEDTEVGDCMTKEETSVVDLLKFEESNDKASISVPESFSQPALSALTRERMDKWKKRKQTKDIKEENEEIAPPLENSDNNVSVESETRKNKKKKKKKNKGEKVESHEKPLTVTVTPNPNITIQSYNHKKVLVALGYDLKALGKERIEIKMPPTEIPGSSLDSVVGYGEGLHLL